MRKSLTALFAAAALAGAAPAFAHAEHAAQAKPAAPTVAATQAALRDLWIGHVFWVRNVVQARFAGNAAEAKAAQQQVVANARAIADSIAPFYGKPASDQLFGLLAGHWGAISEYLDATRAGNAKAADAAFGKLVANAGEISKFLSSANPNLPYDTLQGLLTAHGAHHVAQIKEFKAGQYEQEAKTWAAMKDHMYVIADALAGAITKQFPAKFSA